MSRRKPQSPLTAIIEFFMAAPIAQAQSGLEAAQAVVSARARTAAPLTANVPAARRRVPPDRPAPAITGDTTGGLATTAPPMRQRAVRSDAGKPRNAAATVPVRHRRPPITPPVDAAPLPDSYVPPEAEDAEV